MGKPSTVDEYLAGYDGAAGELLRHLRAVCDAAVPQATTALKWGAPAWIAPSGTILFVINGHGRWGSIVFTPSTKEAFAEQLTAAGLATGKGSVKLPYGEALPEDLLREMIAFRVHEHEIDGVLWM